jgi:hypothetical protein
VAALGSAPVRIETVTLPRVASKRGRCSRMQSTTAISTRLATPFPLRKIVRDGIPMRESAAIE